MVCGVDVGWEGYSDARGIQWEGDWERKEVPSDSAAEEEELRQCRGVWRALGVHHVILAHTRYVLTHKVTRRIAREDEKAKEQARLEAVRLEEEEKQRAEEERKRKEEEDRAKEAADDAPDDWEDSTDSPAPSPANALGDGKAKLSLRPGGGGLLGSSTGGAGAGADLAAAASNVNRVVHKYTKGELEALR